MYIFYVACMLFSFGVHLFGANNDVVVQLPNKKNLSICLDNKDPHSDRTFRSIINEASKQERMAYLVALPKTEDYNILDGNAFINSFYYIQSEVLLGKKKVRKIKFNYFYSIFITKNNKKQVEVAHVDTTKVSKMSDVLDEKNNKSLVYYRAYAPTNLLMCDCKKVVSQELVAYQHIQNEKYDYAFPLLKKIIGNPECSLKTRRRVLFTLGQMYLTGQGCKKNLSKAEGYFESVGGKKLNRSHNDSTYQNMFADPQEEELIEQAKDRLNEIASIKLAK